MQKYITSKTDLAYHLSDDSENYVFTPEEHQKNSCRTVKISDGSKWTFKFSCSKTKFCVMVGCILDVAVLGPEKCKEMHERITNEWNKWARLYYSVPWNGCGFASKKMPNKSLPFVRVPSPSTDGTCVVLLFEATVTNTEILTLPCGIDAASHIGNSTLPKIIICFVLTKSDVNDIVKCSSSLKPILHSNYSWLMSSPDADMLVSKLSKSETPSDLFNIFGKKEQIVSENQMLCSLLNAIIISNNYSQSCNMDELKKMCHHWIDIFKSGKYSAESIKLFLQFVYGKRDGFTRDQISKTDFYDFILLVTNCLDFESTCLYDVLSVFTSYMSDCYKTAGEFLLHLVRNIIGPSESEYFGCCRLFFYYFAQDNNSQSFNKFLKRMVYKSTEFSKIDFTIDGFDVSSESLIGDRYVKESICDRVIEKFSSKLLLKNISYEWSLIQCYNFLDKNNWFYLRKLHMLEPVGYEVCICHFLVSEQDGKSNNNTTTQESRFEDEYCFLNHVHKIANIDINEKPTYPDMYFEFRFSSPKFNNFIIATPSPIAYLRWPWFKLMIDSGLNESKTKSLLLPYDVTPEIMFAIACCLANRFDSKIVSLETLQWIRSDESGIIGIRDSDGNPHPVFKHLFVE